MSDQQFSEERLTNLINRYNEGAPQLWASYAQKAELVHLIICEVAKRGCKATLSSTLARLTPPVKYSTARYMDWWYRTHVLRELPDPDDPDPRNRLVKGGEVTAVTGSGVNPVLSQNGTSPAPPPKPRAPMIIFALKGEIGIAVAVLKRYFGLPDFVTTVKESVLRMYRQVETPTVSWSTPDDEQQIEPEAEARDEDAA